MTDAIRWGILGTGGIAQKFAADLAFAPGAHLAAVGSRTAEAAERFGQQFNIPRRHASYAALAADPEVDVIYVATPHAVHMDNSLLCLQAGKAVLCEKPFTLNAAQAQRVIDLARQRRLFLMEAMWTRYIPLVTRLRAMLAEGVIGDLQMLLAGLGRIPGPDAPTYMFDPALGGGILLDAGVYPVSLASLFFGPPVSIVSNGQLTAGGVDDQDAIILGYGAGQMAVLYMTMRAGIPPEFTLIGTKGRIHVHPPIFRPTRLTLSLPGQPDQTLEMPVEGNGWNYQALEVMRCLRAGQLESPVMPLDETLAILRTMDQLRAQWGLKYPLE